MFKVTIFYTLENRTCVTTYTLPNSDLTAARADAQGFLSALPSSAQVNGVAVKRV